jgi:aminoglycoside 6'-N-acetyltransferase
MMNLAIDWCFSIKEVHTILIDPIISNIDAIRFYERLGFVKTIKRRMEKDLC